MPNEDGPAWRPGASSSIEQDLPLDLCIVRAGVAGTVAAFRTRELGLRFRLIERECARHRQCPLERVDRAEIVVPADSPPAFRLWSASTKNKPGFRSSRRSVAPCQVPPARGRGPQRNFSGQIEREKS